MVQSLHERISAGGVAVGAMAPPCGGGTRYDFCCAYYMADICIG